MNYYTVGRISCIVPIFRDEARIRLPFRNSCSKIQTTVNMVFWKIRLRYLATSRGLVICIVIEIRLSRPEKSENHLDSYKGHGKK